MIIEYPSDLDRDSIIIAEENNQRFYVTVSTSYKGYYLHLDNGFQRELLFKVLGYKDRESFLLKVEEILGYCDNEGGYFPWIHTLKDLKKLIKEL